MLLTVSYVDCQSIPSCRANPGANSILRPTGFERGIVEPIGRKGRALFSIVWIESRCSPPRSGAYVWV